MKIYKMHSNGNDFLLMKYVPGIDYTSFSKRILNRHTGVGAMGLIILKENPLEMILYNPLGNRDLMSVNALCCFSKLCYDLKLVRRNKLEIITGQGLNNVLITKEIPFSCQVNIGVPNFNNQMIYVNDILDSFGRIIRVNGIDINTYSFNLGGVNTIVFIDSKDSKYLDYAEAIANHNLFKRHTNVTFVLVKNKLNLWCKTYNYREGFLKASGAGCAAAVVAANRLGLTKGKVTCEVELGTLTIEIGKKDNVFLEGPAEFIFEADYNEEEMR